MIPAKYNLLIPKGATYELAVTALCGEIIKVTGDATPDGSGVATIPCKAIREALPSGSRLYFFDGSTATVSENLAIGSKNLKVSNLAFAISKNTEVQRIADLTGCQARSQIKKALKDTIALAVFAVDFDSDRSLGKLTLSLPAATTENLPANIDLKTALAMDEDILQAREPQTADYSWDLEIIYSNGKIERPLNGVVLVSPESTTPQTS